MSGGKISRRYLNVNTILEIMGPHIWTPYKITTTIGPKRDEEIGGWRKLHNEELHNLYSSPSIIRVIK
jgi:hypothetical protein